MTPRPLAVALAAATLVAITACDSSAEPAAITPTLAPTSPSPSSPPSLTPTPRPLPTVTPSPSPSAPATNRSPLSGRPGGAGKRVLAVKIDNTLSAQPQAGLRVADVVYVQEVEGGLTRLLALFSTRMPDRIGPVRSARISDVSLLAPYGKVAFAYSGAQSKLLPVLDAANVVLSAPEKGSPGWQQETWRPVSYINLMANPRALLTWARGSARVPDTGWVFSNKPPAGGTAVREISANWAGSRMEFRWDAQRRGFVVSANGQTTRAVEGGPQVAATVIVQRVRQKDSGYGDRYGGRTPFIHTVGKGAAIIARDGKMWSATWTRASEKAMTQYTLSDGSVMSFARGQVWIALLDRDIAPRVR